jgi:hypothetical protein
MSRGVVIFGVNNAKVDYIRLAIMCAGFVKKNMDVEYICLITDKHSQEYYEGTGDSLSNYFTHVRLIPEGHEDRFENRRAYRDTRYYHVDALFRNETRSMVYDLTPFDETLLLDCDFLVGNNVLDCVWGNDEEVMINKDAVNLLGEPLAGPEFRLNPFGIKMYWATVIYFRKSEKAALLFNLVEHVKENWEFYKMLYEVPGHLYRNDYAFSIAIHILNGFVESDDVIAPLPDPVILTSLDTDQLFKVRSPTDISIFVNDPKETWKFYVSRLKGLNVHCMNKLSLLNNIDDILEAIA